MARKRDLNGDLDSLTIKNAKPGKLHDGNGLYLDKRSASSASWVFKFTWNGKPDEVGLGSFKKVTLAQARELREWCLDEMHEERNPRETRRAGKLAAIRAAEAHVPMTVEELARKFTYEIAGPGLESPKHAGEWAASLNFAHIGRIARLLPHEVQVEDVESMLRAYYTGLDAKGNKVRDPAPVMANYVRQRLCRVLGWARATRRITTPGWENPARMEDNLEHTLARKRIKHDPHASIPHVEIGGFVADLRLKEPRVSALAVEWQIISACRPGEAAGAAWDEIDLEHNCWVIPAERMKMRRTHRVPLTARHLEILALLKPEVGEPVFPVLFPVNGRALQPQTMRQVVRTVRGTGSWITSHGFRATFGTWARAQTFELALPNGRTVKRRVFDEALVEECLAHVVGNAARGAYVRDDFLEERRDIMDCWAEYVGIVRAATVTPLRKVA